jgi:hypothetical protein
MTLNDRHVVASRRGGPFEPDRASARDSPSTGERDGAQARSLRIKKKNMLRIVERPRLEARKKRLTKQQLSPGRQDRRDHVVDDLVADL